MPSHSKRMSLRTTFGSLIIFTTKACSIWCEKSHKKSVLSVGMLLDLPLRLMIFKSIRCSENTSNSQFSWSLMWSITTNLDCLLRPLSLKNRLTLRVAQFISNSSIFSQKSKLSNLKKSEFNTCWEKSKKFRWTRFPAIFNKKSKLYEASPERLLRL